MAPRKGLTVSSFPLFGPACEIRAIQGTGFARERGAMPWGTDDHLRFFPNLTWQSNPQIEAVRAMVPESARIVDLGAGGRRITERTICVDMAPLPNVNLVADVERLPFRDGTIDLLFATGLLEHVDDDRRVMGEIARVLKPGGIAHVELPFLQQYHEDPIDCRRFTT